MIKASPLCSEPGAARLRSTGAPRTRWVLPVGLLPLLLAYLPHLAGRVGEPEDKRGNERERERKSAPSACRRRKEHVCKADVFPMGRLPKPGQPSGHAASAVRAGGRKAEGARPDPQALETRLSLAASSPSLSILRPLFLSVPLPPSCHSSRSASSVPASRVTADQGSPAPRELQQAPSPTAMTAGRRAAMEGGPGFRGGACLSPGDPGKLYRAGRWNIG